ncbi:MAG: hypothetical protein ACOCQD_03995, partial [archaeon]
MYALYDILRKISKAIGYKFVGVEDIYHYDWGSNGYNEIWTFTGHSGDVFSVSFSPDGNYIASGS